MRILAYNHRPDETAYFHLFSRKYQVEVVLCDQSPSADTVSLAKGFDCISIIGTALPAELLEQFSRVGVRFVSTRTIGYDHIDVKAAHGLGLEVSNASYSTNSVADFAIMLMLMLTRRMRAVLIQADAQNYSLDALQGRELPHMTVGVMGAGRIGRTVIQHLSGFGCKILAYDPYEDAQTKQYAEYVAMERLIAESDIITLHMPATPQNHHIINRDTIAAMKDGAMVINTARGSLVDTAALIEGIEQKKLGGAALDVLEQEEGIFYNDLSGQVVPVQELAILRAFPNVIVTPHIAFYTDQAVSDMVEHSIESCVLFMQGKPNPWQLPH